MAEYKINYTQSNFTGGIIAAELYGRNDFNKVKSGLKKCTNWTIREAGGLEFRRGTKYINTIPAAAGTNFKMASLDSRLFFFCSDGIRFLPTQTDSMPVASTDNVGVVYQYTGTTTASYTKNSCYQCVSDGEEPATYSWSEVPYAWQLMTYPTGITPDLSKLQFTELKRRLYYYDGTMKMCEVVLTAGVPSTAISKFETSPSGATITAVEDGNQPDVYVPFEHVYTFSLSSSEQEEGIRFDGVASEEANVELTAANSEDNKGQQVNVTITLTSDQASTNVGGKIYIYKFYQGYFYFLTAKDITYHLVGVDAHNYTRDYNNDTSSALAWKYNSTSYYTSGTVEPATGDTIYSDSACTTAVTTISSIEPDVSYTYEDKGQVQPDVSKTPKENPGYIESDGSIAAVNSIADYNQRLFLTRTNQDVTQIIFSAVGNTSNFAYSTQREDTEAGNLELPISNYDSWCKVTSGLDLILSTSYTISKVSGYGDLTTETILWDGLSKTVDPVRTRRSLIYTNTSNRNIYDLTYNEYGQYDSIDLTLLVKYIFEEKTIKRLAFKDYPVKTIYVLCSDGDLYCLTYIKDQNIYAWYKIEHAGTIYDLCVVNTDIEDEVYVVVNYDGTYILEQAYHRTDNIYLDCACVLRTAQSK